MNTRDKLIELIRSSHKKCKSQSNCHECKKYGNGSDCVYIFIADDLIENGVTMNRSGHWNVGYFHDRVCSCCLHPDNDLNDYAHSYCPHCGAKMDS